MRSLARLLTVGCLLVATTGAAPSLAAEDPPPPAVGGAPLAALAERQGKLISLRGRFRQEVTGADGTVRRRLGDVALMRDGATTRFHLRTADSEGFDAQRWCSDGRTVWLVERTTPDDPPLVRERRGDGESAAVLRLISCLRLDLPVLEREFTITLEPAESGSRLRLVPRTDDLRRDLDAVEVQLDANQDPQRVRVALPGGETIAIILETLERDVEIPASWFSP